MVSLDDDVVVVVYGRDVRRAGAKNRSVQGHDGEFCKLQLAVGFGSLRVNMLWRDRCAKAKVESSKHGLQPISKSRSWRTAQLKWAFAPSVPSLTSVSLLPSSVTRSQSAIVDQPFAQYFTSPSHCSVRALLSSLHSDPRWPLKSTTASRPLPLCCDSHAHPAHYRDRYCRN